MNTTTQMTYDELRAIVTERAPQPTDICYVTQDEWDSVVRIAALTFNARPNRLECCFDEMYAMWVVAEFWKTQ